MNDVAVPAAKTCAGCGIELAPGFLACPSCHRLVYSEQLKDLAAAADTAAANGQHDVAIATWEQALALLPPGSRQHDVIHGKLTALRAGALSFADTASATNDSTPASGGRWKWITGGTAIAAVLWKFKFILVFALTKGKLLLLGLTKTSTLLSMLASIGVYWAAWGLWFALGFVLSIYVHEMGHVAALRRYGVPATAPMFIPGLGAFVRADAMPSDPHQEAQIGLAGPLWGLGAALAAYGAFMVTGNRLWAAIAQSGALLNVFNLTPIWQLDGSRGFAAFSRSQRWLAVLAAAFVWWATGEGLFVLVLIVAAGRALIETAPDHSDVPSLGLYVFLLAAFAAVAATLPRA